MPLFRFIFIGAIIAMGLLNTPASGQSADAELNTLIDQIWNYRLDESPLMATYVGDHRANDRLDSMRLEDIERRAKQTEQFLKQLQAIDRDKLSSDARANYSMIGRELRNSLAEHRFRTYLMPIDSRSGFHVAFPDLANQVPLVTTKDFENYIARLNDFSRYTDEHLTLLREGIRLGYTQPAIIMEGTQESASSHVVSDPTQSLMYEPFESIPSTVPASENARLQAEAKAAITDSVVPAYQRILDFLNNEYLPNCREDIATRSLPDGADYYRYCVSKFTTLDDLTPEQVHATGLAEVARIRKEMEQVVQRTGFEGTLPEFIEYLRTDPKFYADTPEQLLKECGLICKRIDGELPRLFSRLPRNSYGLKAIPDYIAPKTTAAYYQPPPGDGTRAGIYYLNTYKLESRSLYMLEALTLHEAVPGHHLQIALQYELDELPEFRQFSDFTVYVEGWALYAERLGLEAGFYEDPYSDFGRLSMEIWRACRLVVDTGMHYQGWTRQQAIDYMSENTGLSMHDIRSEIDRYIGWPGQALAYKIGELRIRELRAMAEEQLQEDFDIRQFHAVVLESGAVPLDVLEENVRGWVEQQKATLGR